MNNYIVFSDKFSGIDWFYNHSKESFIHPDKADLSSADYWTEKTYVSEFIAEIALSEFKCSSDYLDCALGIRAFNF